MYKVFIDNKCIKFTDKEKKFNNFLGLKEKYFSKKELRKIITNFSENNGHKKLLIYHWDLDEIFLSLFSIYEYIKAAGGIVINKKKEVLFILRNEKWDLPKGKLENGESPKTAAIREVKEECGITNLELKEKYTTTFHLYKINNKWIIKKTWWFIMNSDFNKSFIPQIEEGITKVKWINRKEYKLIKHKIFLSIKKVLKEFNFS